MRAIKFRVWCKNRKEWEKDICFIGLDGNIYQQRFGFQVMVPVNKNNHATLLMIVYYEVKLNGDEVESTFNKEKRTLPVGFVSFAQDDLPEDENVYIEVEQVLV